MKNLRQRKQSNKKSLNLTVPSTPPLSSFALDDPGLSFLTCGSGPLLLLHPHPSLSVVQQDFQHLLLESKCASLSGFALSRIWFLFPQYPTTATPAAMRYQIGEPLIFRHSTIPIIAFTNPNLPPIPTAQSSSHSQIQHHLFRSLLLLE